MYINENYNNYKYLVYASDNYICLSNSSRVEGSSGDPDSINVIYNYFNNGFILEDSLDFEYSKHFNNIEDSFSNNITDLGLFPQIFICGFILIFVLIFIINNLTKLVKKGGVFGSN